MKSNECDNPLEGKNKASELAKSENAKEEKSPSSETSETLETVEQTVDSGQQYELDIRDFLDVVNSCAGILETMEASMGNHSRAARLIDKSLGQIERIIDLHILGQITNLDD